ncbi:MAG: hypothetical protein Fur007_11170 [Rhodoferax sp.]
MGLTLDHPDAWALLTHFLSLSLLAVGGAISTVPDMHRTLVDQHQWLSDAQFNAAIALAQAAPGPNVLFVALLGWQVGLNAASGADSATAGASAALGMALAMVGILLPSSVLTFAASRWGHRNRERRAVRAFKLGLAPVIIGLLGATAWVLAANLSHGPGAWPLWALAGAAALLVWRTRIHLLVLLGVAAVLGWLGWV